MTIHRGHPPPDIHRRHRHLLDTLVELVGDLERSSPRIGSRGEADEALRAIISFLRHGVLAFAHGEERSMTANQGTAEVAAFEHGFLEAEIESLACEARPLLETGPASELPFSWRDPAYDRLRRRLYRIEAVLEMHVEREAEAAAVGSERAHEEMVLDGRESRARSRTPNGAGVRARPE